MSIWIMISQKYIQITNDDQILGTQESAQKMGINNYAKKLAKNELAVELAASFSADSDHL